jgi:hypothetical protein
VKLRAFVPDYRRELAKRGPVHLAAEVAADQSIADAPLTIDQKRLAAALGVSPEPIEIVVRA